MKSSKSKNVNSQIFETAANLGPLKRKENENYKRSYYGYYACDFCGEGKNHHRF